MLNENENKNKEEFSMVEVPKDTLRIFLRPKHPMSRAQIKHLSDSMKKHRDDKVIFITSGIEIVIVRENGETKVY